MGHTDVRIGSLFVYDVLILASDSNATAQAAINGASPSAVIGFQAGTHAERKITGRLGQTYRGDPNGLTVFDGSRLVTGWSGSNPWVANHTITDRGVFIDTTGLRTATGDDVGAQYPEELFYETVGTNSGWTRKTRKGQPSTTTPSAGQWTISYSGGTLRVAEDPTAVNVRVSVTDTAIVPPTFAAGGLTIEDITFQKYATDIWHSAAGSSGDHRDWTYRRVAMIDCHGSGFYLGPGDRVFNSRSVYTGFEGFDADGEASGYVAGFLLQDSEIAYNKRARYDWGWSGGGSKMDLPTSGAGSVIRNCWWHHNNGPAIWTDLNETETSTNTIESCLIESNEHAGIFIEIGNPTMLIRWNTVQRNGVGDVANNGGPAVSGDYGPGIDISNSRNCEVAYNKVVDNAHGVMVRDDDRSPTLNGANVHHNSIRIQSGGNSMKYRPGAGSSPIGTCGADNNQYWTPQNFSYNNVFGMSFAAWQAARSGTGLTGALDPNGTGGLTGSITDPSSWVPFVVKHYGPGP